ncbi:helix-turn-helix domain-containing protein [Corynebacterium sp. A21]|uniref:helix-turn-helix domain-containing protein n=1 Tax=Corynebacterium sp. A21 TaxID=3457318 RepID=UPI003FD55660
MTKKEPQWKAGQLLVEARERNGMRQADVAKTAGVSRSTVINAESGTRYKDGEKVSWAVPASTLAKIAVVSGADVKDVLTAAGYDSNTLAIIERQGIIDVSDLSNDDVWIVTALVRAIREARARGEKTD